jgi:uncharacterized protein YdaU (DUF1376 family)
MADANPWHKRYHSDALTGYRGLTLEQRGAYTTILDLLYDAGQDALPSSERWMAGQLDISVRKWRVIRDELAALGKLVVLPDGRITNNRYLRELGKKNALSDKRADAGAKGGKASPRQAEMALNLTGSTPENELKTSGDSAFSTPENVLSGEDNSGEQDAEGAENSHSWQASASDLPPIRARVPDTRYQKLDKKEDNYTANVVSTSPRDGDDDDRKNSEGPPRDLIQAANRYAVIGGTSLQPHRPDVMARELDVVKDWRTLGVSDDLIVATIEQSLRNTTVASIASLRFYDGAIRKAHALAERKAGRGGPSAPVNAKAPIAVRDDADPRLAKVRTQLRDEANGAYATWLAPEHTAFKVDGSTLILKTRSQFFSNWIDANLKAQLERAARLVECNVVRVEPI